MKPDDRPQLVWLIAAVTAILLIASISGYLISRNTRTTANVLSSTT
jgi:hypothetical protein